MNNKERLNAFIVPAIIFAIGISFSLYVAIYSSRTYRKGHRERFAILSQNLRGIFTRQIVEGYAGALESLRDACYVDEDLTREDFGMLCRRLVDETGFVSFESLEWIEHLPSDGGGERFVTKYIEPYRAYYRRLGQEAAYDNVRRGLMNSSIITGRMAASAPAALDTRGGRAQTVTAILPLLEDGFEDGGGALGLGHIKGFIAAVIKADSVFKYLNEYTGANGLRLALLDDTERDNPVQMAGEAVSGPRKGILAARWRTQFGGRDWLLRAESVFEYPAGYLRRLYIVLSAAVVFFALIAYLVYSIMVRANKTSELLVQHMKELKDSNMKLRRLMGAQTKFTTTVSHELKTPLAAIKTAIDIILHDKTSVLSPEIRHFLSKAKENTDRLSRLITDVLDLSRLESGRTPLRIAPTSLNELIKDVADVQMVIAQSQGIYLRTDLQQDLPLVEIDGDKIDQVISNLISNAIKFTETGGVTVTSRADTEHNYVEVCVSDTGKGISREDLPKVFQKFYQLEAGEDVKKGGTGLGLAICKEIIVQHKGKIWVESVPGRGSAFYFRLRIEFSRLVVLGATRKKILLIEDERDLSEMVQFQLKNEGYEVEAVYDGLDGLKMLETMRPDLIILDINLPKMGGIELYKRISLPDGRPRYPVLVMTARVNLEEVFKDIKVDGFVSKPFEINVLLSEVRDIFEKRADPVVYILDNEESDRVRAAVKTLRENRYNAVYVKDTEVIKREAEGRMPDYLFMEYMHSEGSGEALIKKVRSTLDSIQGASERKEAVPIIVYSHTGFEDYADRSLGAGADVYIGKPEDPNTFVATLEKLGGADNRRSD